MDYIIRQLGADDVTVLTNMLQVFGDAFEDPHTYHAAVPRVEYLKRMLCKPDFIALAAMDGEAVIGGLAAYELEKFEQERKEIYIYDLAVVLLHRRKGVATKLIRELQRIAFERGAYIIFVQADKGDDPAIALYESLGTKEEVLHFDILPKQ